MSYDWEARSTQFWVEYLKAQGYCRTNYNERTISRIDDPYWQKNGGQTWDTIPDLASKYRHKKSQDKIHCVPQNIFQLLPAATCIDFLYRRKQTIEEYCKKNDIEQDISIEAIPKTDCYVEFMFTGTRLCSQFLSGKKEVWTLMDSIFSIKKEQLTAAIETGDDVKIQCSPQLFIVFLMARNEAGLVNSWQDLKVKLIEKPVPKITTVFNRTDM